MAEGVQGWVKYAQMDHSEDWWLAVGLGAAALWAFQFVLRNGGSSEMLGTVLGGLIVAGIISGAWRLWRSEQEESLIRAFRDESKSDLAARVPIYKAVNRAGLQDPSPVLDRLQRKRHIVVCYRHHISKVPREDWLTDKDPIDPDHMAITYEGLQRANGKRPPLLKRLRRG